LNQNTDAEKLSVMVAEKVVEVWVMLRLRRGGVTILWQRKILQGRSKYEGGGEKSRASGYKLNITDNIILIVTP
jgi:hypothetical protein